jgi:endonuclease YncB( thermonuclease family)
MLIEPDGFRARTDEGFETPSRRSVIAQDRQGRLLLMVTDVFGTISFAELQSWLLESGLEVNIAFALDGGRSTGMVIRRPDEDPLVISALSDLPLVLAVYGR